MGIKMTLRSWNKKKNNPTGFGAHIGIDGLRAEPAARLPPGHRGRHPPLPVEEHHLHLRLARWQVRPLVDLHSFFSRFLFGPKSGRPRAIEFDCFFCGQTWISMATLDRTEKRLQRLLTGLSFIQFKRVFFSIFSFSFGITGGIWFYRVFLQSAGGWRKKFRDRLIPDSLDYKSLLCIGWLILSTFSGCFRLMNNGPLFIKSLLRHHLVSFFLWVLNEILPSFTEFSSLSSSGRVRHRFFFVVVFLFFWVALEWVF